MIFLWTSYNIANGYYIFLSPSPHQGKQFFLLEEKEQIEIVNVTNCCQLLLITMVRISWRNMFNLSRSSSVVMYCVLVDDGYICLMTKIYILRAKPSRKAWVFYCIHIDCHTLCIILKVWMEYLH